MECWMSMKLVKISEVTLDKYTPIYKNDLNNVRLDNTSHITFWWNWSKLQKWVLLDTYIHTYQNHQNEPRYLSVLWNWHIEYQWN